MLSLLTYAMLLGSPPPPQKQPLCPGFTGGHADRIEADTFYLHRSLAVVSAAVKADAATLRELVAPDARFEVWRGDYASSSRDRGLPGAMEFVRDLKPFRYQSESITTGPISFVSTTCTWDIIVLFRTQDPSHGATVKFSFRDGKVISAIGHGVELLEGSVR